MIPVRYSDRFQSYQDVPQYPYPMNFVQAPSPGNQVLVNYRGQPMLQGLSVNWGPVSFPVREPVFYPRYPPTSGPLPAYGILDPYQTSFLSYQLYPSRYQHYQGCRR